MGHLLNWEGEFLKDDRRRKFSVRMPLDRSDPECTSACLGTVRNLDLKRQGSVFAGLESGVAKDGVGALRLHLSSEDCLGGVSSDISSGIQEFDAEQERFER